MMNHDLGYYERRMQQERRAAAAAESIQSRRVHEEMADLYAKMVQVLSSVANDPE